MRHDLEVKFPDGKPDADIVCAHCGLDKAATIRPNYTYVSCDCPGGLDLMIKGFDEMKDLPKRLEDFESWLEREPCTWKGCIVQSNTARMCPACRLRMAFFHCIYNAEAYYPEAIAAMEKRLGIKR